MGFFSILNLLRNVNHNMQMRFSTTMSFPHVGLVTFRILDLSLRKLIISSLPFFLSSFLLYLLPSLPPSLPSLPTSLPSSLPSSLFQASPRSNGLRRTKAVTLLKWQASTRHSFISLSSKLVITLLPWQWPTPEEIKIMPQFTSMSKKSPRNRSNQTQVLVAR